MECSAGRVVRVLPYEERVLDFYVCEVVVEGVVGVSYERSCEFGDEAVLCSIVLHVEDDRAPNVCGCSHPHYLSA